MDYWFWGSHAVFVCDGYLAWFNNQGKIIGPGGRINRQPFDDYLVNGPWVSGVPGQVTQELTATIHARQNGSPRPAAVAGPHPFRPAAGPRDEWEYFGPYGVRFEGDHLLWYEKEGSVRFASGGACEQTFDEFIKYGPHMDNVPADVAAEVAAAIETRMAAAGKPPAIPDL
ncbi:MAG: hypothetical protein JWM11_1911 [Planctomycetaceae bacterium]|nr:hypothetical protein [Planctomycetaceae bacterium]